MFPIRDLIESRTVPIISYLIILLNCIVFLFELSLGEGNQETFFQQYGFVPSYFFSNPGLSEAESIFSSMFLHAGWAHVIGNMWFMWIFGDNVEDRFGHIGFIFFYLFTGLCAALTQAFIDPHSQIAMVGASGAISGVLGAYFVFYPTARVEALIPFGYFSRITVVPAVIFLGIWFGMQLIPGLTSLASVSGGHEVGGVAFWAHVGGFVSGYIIAQMVRVVTKDSYGD
jgi:membrane associated rhomboid family serine protease